MSEASKKWIQSQKDSVNQVHKAAMAINAQVIAEMEIPESYIEALPKVTVVVRTCANVNAIVTIQALKCLFYVRTGEQALGTRFTGASQTNTSTQIIFCQPWT